MERLLERNRISKLIVWAGLIATPLFAFGGTRFIPPPPPRHANDSAVDGIRQESEWGVYPAITSGSGDRFEALRDDEGEEIDFNRGTLSRRRVGNRAPAGLEISGDAKQASEEMGGWKSSPTDESRRLSKEATASTGKRPVLRRVSKTEMDRQENESQKFMTEVEDPVARRKGVQEIALVASDLGFFPKTIFVSRDVPVRLYVTGASKGSLCLMMDSFNVRKQIRSNKIEEITFVANDPGTYRFYCPVNGSEGTMVVKELTTNLAGDF